MSIWTETHADADPLILPPNRYSTPLRMWFIRCQCGRWDVGQRDGILMDHFPQFTHDNRSAQPDIYERGAGMACRYSGRSITLQAALDRDSQLNPAERRVHGVMRERLREKREES